MNDYVGKTVYIDDFLLLGDANAGHIGDDDWTAVIRKALYCGSKHIIFTTNKTYNINLSGSNFLALFDNVTDFIIEGNGAVLNDSTQYTTQNITSIFWFMGGNNISVTGLKYSGITLTTPSTDMGYYGATFVRTSHGTANITVQSQMLQHLRYGVLSGDYSDYSYGGCSEFNIDLMTNHCGYPYALYYADTVNVNIYADYSHRSAYQAGCIGVSGTIQCKNQYVAPIQCLLTDCFISAGRSRGCKDISLTVTYLAASWLAGISLSRVDPTIVYENINITTNLVGTDTVSSSIGSFIINSTCTLYQPIYQFDFDPWVHINNITISGTIDRTAQTVNTTLHDIYVLALDYESPTHFATVSNLKFKDLNLLAGTGFGAQQKTLNINVPGLIDTLTFENCNLTSYEKSLSLGSGNEIIL